MEVAYDLGLATVRPHSCGSPGSTRGRAVSTAAALRGVTMAAIADNDPMVDELMRLPAYVLDCIRLHCRKGLL